MKRKVLFLAITAIMIISIFAGCTKTEENKSTQESTAPKAKPDKQTILRLAEIHPADYPTTLGDKEFARIVEEKTNGRVKIEVYHGGQLGQEKAVIEQVQFGAIDFARISIAPVSEFAKELNALQLPYIYRNEDHMWKVLDGQIGQELLKSVEKAKMVGLCFYEAGARSFYTSKKEVKTLADLKGLKIRVQESKLMMDLIKALGASPTPMAAGEVYSCLQTGIIDGAENNWPTYISGSHYEVAKNYTVDEHTRVPEIIVASSMTISKLSKEDQDIIKQAAKDSVKLQRTEWAKKDKESEQKAIAAGCKINRLDEKNIAEFQKAVAPLYDEYGKDYKDLIKKIQETK